MKGLPTYFGEIAVHEGYISEETLNETLELQKLYRKPTLFGEILLEKCMLTKEHISKILKLQQSFKSKLENEYFAHLTLKKKILTSKQIWELRKKYYEDSLQGKCNTLATIAVMENYVSMPILKEMILQSEEYQYFNKLKKDGKSAIGDYEIIGNIINLKKSNIYKAIQVGLERIVAVKALIKEIGRAHV